MTQPIAFYCRARPQDADALPIFEAAKRIFIGNPLLREGVAYNPRTLHTCLVNPTCPDDEWDREIALQLDSSPYDRNRSLVRRVTQGSIVVIPRPEHGAVYMARVVGRFDIINSPPWGEDYLDLRLHQGLDAEDADYGHIADVTQGWPVDGYRRVSLARVPGWLRRSMFRRSTYGYFRNHPLDPSITAYAVFERLLTEDKDEPFPWTLDHEQIKRRLVDTLTANAFEHLMVSLMQLEHPDEIWHQTGGAGDGGISGLGSDESGNVVGLMQSKLYDEWPPVYYIKGDHDEKVRHYVAVLILDGPDEASLDEPDDTYEKAAFLDIKEIAGLVREHWRHLPQARALRIGEA